MVNKSTLDKPERITITSNPPEIEVFWRRGGLCNQIHEELVVHVRPYTKAVPCTIELGYCNTNDGFTLLCNGVFNTKSEAAMRKEVYRRVKNRLRQVLRQVTDMEIEEVTSKKITRHKKVE